MASAPLSPRHRADLERHPKPVALVMHRAAHLRMVPRTPEVLRTPRHVGLEPAACEHYRTCADLMDSARVMYGDAAHAPAAVLHEATRARLVAHLDALFLRGRKPHPREPDALVGRAQDRALLRLDNVADAHRSQRKRGLEPDSLLRHPRRGVVRVRNQDFRQLRVGAIRRHPAQIFPERIAWIGLDALRIAGNFTGLRHEPQDVLGLVECDSQESAAVVRIPAAHLLPRLFEHQHTFGA